MACTPPLRADIARCESLRCLLVFILALSFCSVSLRLPHHWAGTLHLSFFFLISLAPLSQMFQSLYSLQCGGYPSMWRAGLNLSLKNVEGSSTADTYSLNAYFKHQALDNAMLCFLLYASSDYT